MPIETGAIEIGDRVLCNVLSRPLNLDDDVPNASWKMGKVCEILEGLFRVELDDGAERWLQISGRYWRWPTN